MYYVVALGAIQKTVTAYDEATPMTSPRVITDFTLSSVPTTSQIAPVLLPALLTVLEGRERCGKESSSSSSSGSPAGRTVGLESALDCIAVLLNGLNGGSTRPFLRRVEHVACCVLGWDEDDDVTDSAGYRLIEAAACVLSLVPHCGKEVESAWEGAVEAWCAEGISLLSSAWQPSESKGTTSSTTSKMNATSVHSFHHLSSPPLSDMNPSDRLLAVCSRFHGICAVLSYMLKGSTFGRFIHVPTSCILNLIVQALTFVEPRRRGVKRGIQRAVKGSSQSMTLPQTTAAQGGGGFATLSSKFLNQVIRIIRSCALRVLVAMVSAPSAALVRHARRLMECITTCIEAETAENCKPDPQALAALGILSRQLGPGFGMIAADGAIPALYGALNRCRAWKQQPAFSCNNDRKPQKKTRGRPRGGNNNKTSQPQTNAAVLKSECQDERQQYSFSSGGWIPEYSTSGGPAGWDEADLSCFSAAGIRALAIVVSSGGGHLPQCLRSQAEALAVDAIICVRNASGYGIESCERAAWVRGDQAAIAAIDLVISCVQAPLWDGTRSPLVGRAIGLFRWLLSLGESEEIQSAAQNGLSACQALLNPRFAPLVQPTADISSHTTLPTAVATALAPPIDNDLDESPENTVAKVKQQDEDIGEQRSSNDGNSGGVGSSVEEDEDEGNAAAMNVVGAATEAAAFKEDESDRMFTVAVGPQDNDVGGMVAFKDDEKGHNTEKGDNNNKEGSNTADVTPEDESRENQKRIIMDAGESRETGNGKRKNRVAEDLGGCSDSNNNQYTVKKSRNDSLIPSRYTNEGVNTFCGSTPLSLSAAPPLKGSHCMIRNDSEDNSSCGSLPEIDIEDLTDEDLATVNDGD